MEEDYGFTHDEKGYLLLKVLMKFLFLDKKANK